MRAPMPPRFSRLWRSSAARGSPPSWPRGRRRPFDPNPRRAASACSKGDCSHEPARRHSQAPRSPMSECPTGSRWRQALGAIGRRPVAWAVAVIVAGLALGAVLLVAIACWSLRPLVEQGPIAPQATVIVAGGANPAEVDALRNSLSLLPTVAATKFVSHDAALAQIASRTPADRDAIGQLAANPLPDVIVLTFRSNSAPDAVEFTAGAIRKMAHVDAVELDLGWYRKFWALARVGVAVSLAAIAALVVHAAGWLAVALTVSAPIDARRASAGCGWTASSDRSGSCMRRRSGFGGLRRPGWPLLWPPCRWRAP